MQNKYESANVIEIGQAEPMILGSKCWGAWDFFTGAELTHPVDIWDIDE